MDVVCLDLEGVLIPEIWLNLAERSGISELKRTTRDEPDYNKLMAGRLEILRRHGLGISDIQSVIADMAPLPGAADFLGRLRQERQVIILSDTFRQFARPLMQQLDWPTLFCNDLEINSTGEVKDFHLRQDNGKLNAVRAFQSMNLKVLAAGDSYNDLNMILHADSGAFFLPPEQITREHPEIPVFYDYGDFLDFILSS